jgi:hypothetical protein
MTLRLIVAGGVLNLTGSPSADDAVWAATAVILNVLRALTD